MSRKAMVSDKARMDWLSKHTLVEHLWDSGDDCVTRLAAFSQRGSWGRLRDAVDDAIRAERRAGRKS